MFSKKIATLILGLGAALLTGCEAEQTEKDMIAEAQFCLDKARDASSANACMSKIEGITSANAYALRCAAGFISSGITSASNLSQALTALNEDSGNNAVTMLDILNFGSVSDANRTADYCQKSQQKGLTLISALAKSATSLAEAAKNLNLGSCVAGIDQCNAEDLEQAITDILAEYQTDPNNLSAAAENALESVGGAIQSVYSTTCGGSSSANSQICDDINQAAASAGIDIASSNNFVAIGQALLAQWNANP